MAEFSFATSLGEESAGKVVRQTHQDEGQRRERDQMHQADGGSGRRRHPGGLVRSSERCWRGWRRGRTSRRSMGGAGPSPSYGRRLEGWRPRTFQSGGAEESRTGRRRDERQTDRRLDSSARQVNQTQLQHRLTSRGRRAGKGRFCRTSTTQAPSEMHESPDQRESCCIRWGGRECQEIC